MRMTNIFYELNVAAWRDVTGLSAASMPRASSGPRSFLAVGLEFTQRFAGLLSLVDQLQQNIQTSGRLTLIDCLMYYELIDYKNDHTINDTEDTHIFGLKS